MPRERPWTRNYRSVVQGIPAHAHPGPISPPKKLKPRVFKQGNLILKVNSPKGNFVSVVSGGKLTNFVLRPRAAVSNAGGKMVLKVNAGPTPTSFRNPNLKQIKLFLRLKGLLEKKAGWDFSKIFIIQPKKKS